MGTALLILGAVLLCALVGMGAALAHFLFFGALEDDDDAPPPRYGRGTRGGRA